MPSSLIEIYQTRYLYQPNENGPQEIIGEKFLTGNDHAPFSIKGCLAKIIVFQNGSHVVTLSHNGENEGLVRITNEKQVYLNDTDH